jgi:hypothetical protein
MEGIHRNHEQLERYSSALSERTWSDADGSHPGVGHH